MRISQILFVDAEKPREYLSRFLNAAKGVQVIVVSQERDTSHTEEVAMQHGVRFFNASQPHVNGACIWDVLESLRDVWSWIEGEYVSFAHPEFLWLPGMVDNTKIWLTRYQSTVALGNLRRLGVDHKAYRGNPDETTRALRILDTHGDLMRIDTNSWAYWKHEPVAYEEGWLEDVFFARRDFLEAIEFPTHGGVQPFQDVYDLMEVIVDVLRRNDLEIDCVRMPRSANEMWHLHHERPRSWICPEVRDWFRGNERYRDTLLTRDDLWERLLKEKTWTVMSDVRRGPRGTCTRYQCDFSMWLQENSNMVAEYLGNGTLN